MNESRSIGFIGLGAMGMEMAARLLAKGHRVTAHDIRAQARETWDQQGGRWADTPAAAAQGADALILMVVDSNQVQQVLFGPHGAIPALAPGKVVVVHSTVAPSFSQELGARLAQAGYPMLDAPVSGGVVGAKNGTLSAMVSEATPPTPPPSRFLAPSPPGSTGSATGRGSGPRSRR